jgi:hypothetical protein
MKVVFKRREQAAQINLPNEAMTSTEPRSSLPHITVLESAHSATLLLDLNSWLAKTTSSGQTNFDLFIP